MGGGLARRKRFRERGDRVRTVREGFFILECQAGDAYNTADQEAIPKNSNTSFTYLTSLPQVKDVPGEQGVLLTKNFGNEE